MLGSLLRMVFASLLRNRLRTSLTILGIGIGIAAVICTAALGAAGADRVQKQMDALGENFVWIRAGSANFGGVRTGSGGRQTLKAEDATAIVNQVPDVTACSPEVQGRVQIVAGGQNWNTRYQGVWPSFFDIRERTPADGVVFQDEDNTAAARVVVLGESTASQLFGDETAVGKTVIMNNRPFQVIGVLASKGTGGGGIDRDDAAIIPLGTAFRTFDGRKRVADIMCMVDKPAATNEAQAGITAVLRVRHRLGPDDPDDFQIVQPIEFLQMRQQAAQTMGFMLTAIGAVSLLVGGVGIMNIMLVSVTERRREIGVRMAIGARVRDIRWQFLLEAAMLGLVGGVAGIFLGWVSAWTMSTQFDWPTLISTNVMILATVAAVAAGLVFGYLPAHRASGLDPIEAIRLED